MFFDQYVENEYYKAARTTFSLLSSAFGAYQGPLPIEFSPSRDYIKAQVSGDVYIRNVLIRDDLDRHNGYAYYTRGNTERIAVALRIDAKYPYRQNASGTYEYLYPSYSVPTRSSWTPGYYGNASFYQSIIKLYENSPIYLTHDEYIDVQSYVVNLLS